MPPNPPNKAHGFAMRSMSLCDMQISKSEKKILGPPPLSNPGDAPACNYAYEGTANVHLQFMDMGCLQPDTPCQLLCPISTLR